MICCRMLSTSAVSILMPFKSSWGSRAVSSTTTLLRMSRRFSCTDLMGKQSHYWSHEGSTFTFKKLLVFHLFNFSEINLTTKMYHKEGFFLCTTSRACLYRTLTCCHWPRCYSPSSCSDLLSSPSWTCSFHDLTLAKLKIIDGYICINKTKLHTCSSCGWYSLFLAWIFY